MSDSAMYLMQGVTTNTAGRAVQVPNAKGTVQAVVNGTGAVTATVTIYGSNVAPAAGVGQNGISLGTITLSGTTSATDGFTIDAPWKSLWAVTSNVTGTGAMVDVLLGL